MTTNACDTADTEVIISISRNGTLYVTTNCGSTFLAITYDTTYPVATGNVTNNRAVICTAVTCTCDTAKSVEGTRCITVEMTIVEVCIYVTDKTTYISVTGNVAVNGYVSNVTGVTLTGKATNEIISGNRNVIKNKILYSGNRRGCHRVTLNVTEEACIVVGTGYNKIRNSVIATVKITTELVSRVSNRSPLFACKINVVGKLYVLAIVCIACVNLISECLKLIKIPDDIRISLSSATCKLNCEAPSTVCVLLCIEKNIFCNIHICCKNRAGGINRKCKICTCKNIKISNILNSRSVLKSKRSLIINDEAILSIGSTNNFNRRVVESHSDISIRRIIIRILKKEVSCLYICILNVKCTRVCTDVIVAIKLNGRIVTVTVDVKTGIGVLVITHNGCTTYMNRTTVSNNGLCIVAVVIGFTCVKSTVNVVLAVTTEGKLNVNCNILANSNKIEIYPILGVGISESNTTLNAGDKLNASYLRSSYGNIAEEKESSVLKISSLAYEAIKTAVACNFAVSINLSGINLIDLVGTVKLNRALAYVDTVNTKNNLCGLAINAGSYKPFLNPPLIAIG